MPRFYFHISNSLGFTRDEEGRELRGLDAARAVAVEGARSLLSDEVSGGILDLRGRIDVTDEHDRLVLNVLFGDVVEIRNGEIPSEKPARKAEA
ncbi:MAG TPA: hypothetical protein VGW34_10870 [Allosphingosinicella sp.]|nr:hypothetical protein [Allosphingosinicella sp.]